MLSGPELDEFREVSQAFINERLARANVIGSTKSGRTIVELIGEPGPAELRWQEISEQLQQTKETTWTPSPI